MFTEVTGDYKGACEIYNTVNDKIWTKDVPRNIDKNNFFNFCKSGKYNVGYTKIQIKSGNWNSN